MFAFLVAPTCVSNLENRKERKSPPFPSIFMKKNYSAFDIDD